MHWGPGLISLGAVPADECGTVPMRRSTLLTQVLAVNAVLVGITATIAAIVARDRLPDATSGDGLLVLGLTVASAILLNSLLLRARLAPMERLVDGMTHVDLARPGMRVTTPRRSAREVHELTDTFNRMLTRLEDERRESGRAVLRAQEQERSRIAQDLHDEVNQALTAILLRLSATIGDAPMGLRSELQETQELVSQAMDELLALARQLRPTALDDHGLVAALASQVSDFGQRTGMRTRFHHHGDVPTLSDEEQLVIFRVTQESLSNIAKHARAGAVDVELSFVGRTVLRVADDGHGFDAASARRVNGHARGRPGGLGLSGMRERALLVGGNLVVFTAPGAGTTIELTMGVT
jgi:two-component system sensor histidine kinase UhpB